MVSGFEFKINSLNVKFSVAEYMLFKCLQWTLEVNIANFGKKNRKSTIGNPQKYKLVKLFAGC